MIDEMRSVSGPEGEIGVHVVRPDGDGPFPVVVFFHHGPGYDEGSKEAARMIAAQGYYVVVPDRYWREEPWIEFDLKKMREPGSEEGRRMFGLILDTTDDMVDADLTAVLAGVKHDPVARDDRMGSIGYCIGARSVLRSLERHPDVFSAGVCLHPSFCVTADDSPHEFLATYDGHIYVGFGAEDKMQSAEAHQPLIDAVGKLGDRGLAEIHAGADHGFAVPQGPAYHESAAERSYAMALSMFGMAMS